MTTSVKTEGAHHIGLTVPNVEETAAFFVDILNFEKVGGRPAYPAIFVSDGTMMVTLWQADAGATAFDRRANLGLHHLAFRVPNAEALEAAHQAIQAADGAEVEFAPEPLNDGPVRHMMCRIPGGLRVEFIAP